MVMNNWITVSPPLLLYRPHQHYHDYNCYYVTCQMTPSINSGLDGMQDDHLLAFPRHKGMERWAVVLEGGRSGLWPWCFPMALIVSLAKVLQPPVNFATRGMSEMPAEWQPVEWAFSFLSSPTIRAWPWEVAASLTWRGWNRKITVTSRAACLPLFQQRYIYIYVCWAMLRISNLGWHYLSRG